MYVPKQEYVNFINCVFKAESDLGYKYVPTMECTGRSGHCTHKL